eukprot:6193398-Pleurochrysis_carterae.AAC.3
MMSRADPVLGGDEQWLDHSEGVDLAQRADSLRELRLLAPLGLHADDESQAVISFPVSLPCRHHAGVRKHLRTIKSLDPYILCECEHYIHAHMHARSQVHSPHVRTHAARTNAPTHPRTNAPTRGRSSARTQISGARARAAACTRPPV